MRNPSPRLGAFNRSLLLWLVAWALLAFGYFGVQGVLFNLWLLRLGFGPEFIGLLTGSGQLLWAIFALPAAAVGRRIGLRGALIAAYALSAAATTLLLLVEALPRPLWAGWLVGWWALLWVGAALNTVNSIPYAVTVAGAARTHAFSAQQAVMALLAFAGSLAAGVLPGLVAGWTGSSLLDAAPYRTALWLVPLAYVLCALALAAARPAPPAEDGAAAVAASTRPTGLLVLLGLVVFLQTAGEGVVRAFATVYLDTGLQVPPAQIGLLLGVAQLVPLAAALVTPRLLARLGTAGTLALASLGSTLALLPLAAIPTWGAAGLGLTGVMLTAAVNSPARSLFSQEVVPARWRTTTSAVLTIGLALGWASTAAAGGFLIRSAGFSSLFLLGAGLALAAAVLMLGYQRARAGRMRLAPAAGQA